MKKFLLALVFFLPFSYRAQAAEVAAPAKILVGKLLAGGLAGEGFLRFLKEFNVDKISAGRGAVLRTVGLATLVVMAGVTAKIGGAMGEKNPSVGREFVSLLATTAAVKQAEHQQNVPLRVAIAAFTYLLTYQILK